MAQSRSEHIYYRESTFDQFVYPNGQLDKEFTEFLRDATAKQWPRARNLLVKSFVTQDDIRKVVSYYSALSGQRFDNVGDCFTYIFSQIDDTPASRIEIHPIPVAKVHPAFWPVRISLFYISYPIIIDLSGRQQLTIDDLKRKSNQLFYDSDKVVLRNDLSMLAMEEMGPNAKVYVLITEDTIEEVYRFFRRRYRGYLAVRSGIDGNVYTRYFEFDASRTVGLDPDEMQLMIQVEENPMIFDRDNNSQVLKGHVLIRYIFWTDVE